MTLFSRSGNNFMVTSDDAVDIRDRLPSGTYTVKYDGFNNRYFLQMVEGYEVPSKIYGDTSVTAVRILETFRDRGDSTGVLLTGEQGSGKTMLAKLLSLEGLKLDIPTILINEPWCGEDFNSFLQMIEQPTVVIFDEFEKVYDSDSQEKMLTLLDGVYPSKKLYVLTCNNPYRVNSHMKNRPGRIFYRLDYEGLEEGFIREYCEDNLKNKDHIENVVRVASVFTAFNFDILKAMVEEMNRYSETPVQVMRFLNASPEYSDSGTYDISVLVGGKATGSTYRDEYTGNPASGKPVSVEYYGPDLDSDGDPKYHRYQFTLEDLEPADGSGAFVFKRGNVVATLSRKRAVSYSFDAM